MKRFGVWASAVVAASLCGVSFAADPAPAQPLPLQQVVMFSSGVGYFQRAGRINGATSLDLSFRADQVNDVLKSLVLIDSAGGVRPVTYTGKDPHLARLGNSPAVVAGDVSLGSLLRRFQGARLRLETAGKKEVTEGRLVSVSTRETPVKAPTEGVLRQDVLNVLTEQGLRAVPLDDVSQIRLLDDRLDRELRETIEALASTLDDQRRKVTISFAGDGAREVKAGYLQEMPVWKTTYRLVLEKGAKPYLQGWAIVENTTEEDWKDVRLSLVSGRPISFIQDLYQPLYLPRPMVAAQVIGSPTPQNYGAALDKGVDAERLALGVQDLAARKSGMPALRAPAAPPAPGSAAGGLGGGGFGGGGMGRGLAEGQARTLGYPVAAELMARSVDSQASGTERGALFEYAIQGTVSIARGQSAMVPIISGPVDGEAISLYDPDSDRALALNGFRLKNNTGMHLSGGPVTIFRDGGYAGDAQIGNVQPGEERLLTYAADLELVVGMQEPRVRQETLSITAKNGVMLITRKQQREWLYEIRNKSKTPRQVVIQQAIEPEFKLVTPEKPSERTPTDYRFLVSVPEGKTGELKIVTERPLQEQMSLVDCDMNILTQWSLNAQVSEKLRGALKDLVTRRRAIVDLQAQRAAAEGELKAIDQEQTRIRQNMMQLDRASPLYMQYVKKLTDQETRIEKLREQSASLREQETTLQKQMRTFIDSLTSD